MTRGDKVNLTRFLKLSEAVIAFMGLFAAWVSAGKSCLQSQLARSAYHLKEREKKKNRACSSTETFLAPTPRGDFFSPQYNNLERWVVNRKNKGKR